MGSLRELLCHVSFSSLLLLLISQKAMCLDTGNNDLITDVYSQFNLENYGSIVLF